MSASGVAEAEAEEGAAVAGEAARLRWRLYELYGLPLVELRQAGLRRLRAFLGRFCARLCMSGRVAQHRSAHSSIPRGARHERQQQQQQLQHWRRCLCPSLHPCVVGVWRCGWARRLRVQGARSRGAGPRCSEPLVAVNPCCRFTTRRD